MKILSIGETDRGGAGLSALKLHNQFVRQGFDANFIVNRKTVNCETVIQIPADRNSEKFGDFRVGQYQSIKQYTPFTTGMATADQDALFNFGLNYDIILLRWTSVFVSDLTISKWLFSRKNVVWCLSDMAPITGGCHYSSGCENYQCTCTPCPLAPPHLNEFPGLVLQRRKKLWRNIVFVSPSKWLAEKAKHSAICRNSRIETIRTGVELDVFKPTPTAKIKKRLGLDPNKHTILFGAANSTEPRKGFHFLPEVIDILNNYKNQKSNFQLLIVGEERFQTHNIDADFIFTGRVDSRSILAEIYSASDVTLLPYIEDNLPNMCLESIACGTPVVTFAIGGLPDVIVDGINGELARPYDTWDLATKLDLAIRSQYIPSKIHSWACENISIENQADNYQALFKSLMAEPSIR